MRSTAFRSVLLLAVVASIAQAQWPIPTPPTPPTPPEPPVAPLPPEPPEPPRLLYDQWTRDFDVVGLSYHLDIQPTLLHSSERYPQDGADSVYR